MDLKVTFNHIEKTDAIEEKIKDKASKLKKYFDGRINVHWICNVEKGQQTSSVTVSGQGFTMNAHATDENLYKTFDTVMEKLDKQLHKRKDKITSKSNTKLTSTDLFI